MRRFEDRTMMPPLPICLWRIAVTNWATYFV